MDWEPHSFGYEASVFSHRLLAILSESVPQSANCQEHRYLIYACRRTVATPRPILGSMIDAGASGIGDNVTCQLKKQRCPG